jgi:hypothetical protein
MNRDHEKNLAEQLTSVLTGRFQGAAQEFFPLAIAKEWQSLFSEPELNLDRMKEIVEKAKARKSEFEINFFAFCNHMEEVLREAIKEQLGGC